MKHLPDLPQLPDDPTGSGAQALLAEYAAENSSPEVAQAVVDWLRKVSGSLFLLRGSAGVQAQTATDIENLRERVFIYDNLLEQNPDQIELQTWVLGPLVRGDFRGVPDALPDDPLRKMPGVFSNAEYKQAEVAWAYQLAKAVGFENDLFLEAAAATRKRHRESRHGKSDPLSTYRARRRRRAACRFCAGEAARLKSSSLW